MSYRQPRTKVIPTVGRENGGPFRPVVILEDVQDWLTPAQARALAVRLNQASDDAIAKHAAHLDKARKARAKKEGR